MAEPNESQSNGQTDSACLVCSSGVIDESVLIPEKVQQFMKTICQVVGLKEEESRGVIDRYTTLDQDIRFCPKCQQNLDTFRELQGQLESLSKQVTSIKHTLYEHLCLNGAKPVSDFRKSLANEYEVRHGKSVVVKPEVITADCVPNPYYQDDPCNNDDLPDFDLSLQWNLKPCEIKLERVECTTKEGRRSADKERKRKKRLEKLKRRQESKRKPKIKQENAIYFSLSCPQPKCRFRYVGEESLRFHTRRVHEGKTQNPYNCFECDAEFDLLTKLRKHEFASGHHTPNWDKGKTKCSQCHRVFRYKRCYQDHLNRQGGTCHRQPRELPLNTTYDSSQKPSQRYLCGLCTRKFRAPNLLAIHVRAAHTDGFAFMCEFCSKPFKVKQTMMQHQRQRHVEQILATEGNSAEILAKVKALTCDTCQQTFSCQASKRDHVAKVHSKVFAYYCDTCGSGWTCKTHLDRHISSVHMDQRNFPCPQCPLKMSRRDKLLRHIRVKHGDGSDKKFVCDHCGKAFFDTSALTRHLNLVHLLKRDDPAALKFKCDHCQYSCVDKHYLRIHMKSKRHLQKAKRNHEAKHLKEYAYQCEICGSGWTTLAELNAHTKRHETNREFPCHICGHSFDRVGKRDRHLATKHGVGNVQKQEHCDLCPKSFWDRSHLQQHVNLKHSPQVTGQFGCDVCNYSCAIRDYLVIHSKTKKHLQKVQALGSSNVNTGLRFVTSQGIRNAKYN